MSTQKEMPLYRSRKLVHALEIASWHWIGEPSPAASALIYFTEEGFEAVTVGGTMFSLYQPKRGDFYVVYDDGYASISPRKAFLDGYRSVTRPSPASEEAIEGSLRAKGLAAPRLTPDHVDGVIVDEAYHVFPGTTLTVCALTLLNGFTVTGESAAASPENFDEEIGRQIARRNAREKIWALEGYLLRERIAGAPQRWSSDLGPEDNLTES